MLSDTLRIPPRGCCELLGAWKAILLSYPLPTHLEKDFPTIYSKEVKMPFVNQTHLGPVGAGSLLEKDPSGS